jgi:hypothetical protein
MHKAGCPVRQNVQGTAPPQSDRELVCIADTARNVGGIDHLENAVWLFLREAANQLGDCAVEQHPNGSDAIRRNTPTTSVRFRCVPDAGT